MKKTFNRSAITGRLIRRARRGDQPERFAWATVAQVPTAVPVHLRGGSKLYPFGDDAILHWVFDVDADGDESVLVLHLTDREAQKVWETPQSRGMIEAVRGNLSDPWGLVIREIGGRPFTRMFRVPSDLVEQEFVADLIGAASGAREWYENYRFMLESELAAKKRQLDESEPGPGARKLREQIASVEREKSVIEWSADSFAAA